jgi:predicted nucleotide-binding protein
MTKKEHIESLINTLTQVRSGDSASLDAFMRKADMIVRNIFGEKSKYLMDLKSIRFLPMIYPSSETIKNGTWHDGSKKAMNVLVTMLEEVSLFHLEKETEEKTREPVKKKKSSHKIFIVHGHDEEMKQSVARTVEKLGMESVILHEKPNNGKTIIEKFSEHSDVSFAIVLLTPDDMGYPAENASDIARPRPRQNVIFELGYFLGKLGREKVICIYRRSENFEILSDFSGVLYIPYDDSGRWQFDIIKELNACGYKIDANKLF